MVAKAFFVMVTYMDRSSLYCSDMNLIQSITNITPFCVISGKDKETWLIGAGINVYDQVVSIN